MAGIIQVSDNNTIEEKINTIVEDYGAPEDITQNIKDFLENNLCTIIDAVIEDWKSEVRKNGLLGN